MKKEFKEHYGKNYDFLFFAPGRVNLIGDHTDYNGGWVFPCALTYGTLLAARKTDEAKVRFASLNMGFQTDILIDRLGEKLPDRTWCNYPLGVVAEFAKRGFVLNHGLELLYHGDIPNGAGLSSSASIEVVTAVMLNELFQANMEMLELVKLSQAAENHFVGVHCGIMDQFAVGMGKAGHALAIKCDILQWEEVPLALSGYRLVIGNTNKQRELAESKYNERRSECEQVVAALSQSMPIDYLGDIDLSTLESHRHLIEDDTLWRRAKHVITENDRVVQATKALRKGDLERFGQMMNDSHNSLRDDYESTGKEADVMVEESRKIDGVLGSRLTGGGFGGCTVSIVAAEKVEQFIAQVGANYQKRIGLEATFYLASVGDGAKRVE